LTRCLELEEIRRELPGDETDHQSRYLEALVDGILIGCLYLPNGNPAPGPKFEYKLQWFDRFIQQAAHLVKTNTPAILAGDFNVIPTELDAATPQRWRRDALFRAESRAAYAKLLELGWVDSIRHLNPTERIYSYWDYVGGAYRRNDGLRIDHLLASPQLAGQLAAGGVDRWVRGWEKTSDHAPTWIELSL
jgi:exodeoxyribonuclease-3